MLKRSSELVSIDHSIASLEACLQACIDKPPEFFNELGANGACGPLDHLLAQQMNSSKIVVLNLELMDLISVQPANVTKFLALATFYRVLKAIHLHLKDAVVVSKAVKLLSKFSSDPTTCGKILACGGCEVIALALRTYARDSTVAEHCCRIVYGMCTGGNDDQVEATQHSFADGGICEVLVVSILLESISDLSNIAVEWSIRAMGSLAAGNAGNHSLLANLGVCEVLLRVIGLFEYAENSLDIAEASCFAIAHLSRGDEDIQRRLRTAGAADYLLRSLSSHIADARFLQEVFRAIHNMARGNVDNLEYFASMGACERVIDAIRWHVEQNETELLQEVEPPSEETAPQPSRLGRLQRSNSSSISVGTAGIAKLGYGGQLPASPAGNRSGAGNWASAFTLGSAGNAGKVNSRAKEHDLVLLRSTVQWGWYAVAGLSERFESISLFRECGALELLRLSLKR